MPSFPPKAIKFLDKDSAGLFLGLRQAILTQKVSYVLGAGASAAAGAPTWMRLLTEICAAFMEHLDHVQLRRGIPAKKISISVTCGSGEARARARKVMEHSPLLAAQLLQNCVRKADWNYLIRKIMYDKADRSSEALRQTARLLRLTPQLNSIINFNYDDLLEKHLPSFDIDYTVLTHDSPKPKRRKLPIYHPHGWLPECGGADSRLVLSEEDYNERSRTPYSWGNIVQISTYCSTTAVFIGHSMTDPNGT